MTDVLIQLLKANMVEQAKFYLQEFSGFYPFAATINNHLQIKPCGVYFGEDHPDSEQVITNFITAFEKGIKNNEYIAVGMGTDTWVTLPDGKKIDALEVRINTKDKSSFDFILPYSDDGTGNFTFTELETKEGSINLF